MRTHYTCSKCNQLLDKDTFYPHAIKQAVQKDNSYIPMCKSCTQEYNNKNRLAIIERRKAHQKYVLKKPGSVKGLIYVICSGIPGNPYKIGLTSGTTVKTRLSGIQCSQWIELKLFWKSKVLENVNGIESKLHKHFKDKHVRGEWFNINKTDIRSIPKLIISFI